MAMTEPEAGRIEFMGRYLRNSEEVDLLKAVSLMKDFDFSQGSGFAGRETRRGTKLVMMESDDHIEAKPDQELRIGTFGLSTCTAVAVAWEFPDGSRKAYLQHYSAMSQLYSADRLKQAVSAETDFTSAR